MRRGPVHGIALFFYLGSTQPHSRRQMMEVTVYVFLNFILVI